MNNPEKMKLETPNLTAANVMKIAELFPGVVSEGKVNFDLLRSMLGDEEMFGHEAYEFTWVGKRAAIAEAGRPVRKTLRPCVAESKDWDTTENLYIEGDNLDVLKLLQESYLGKVKMVYIDPPYNTGNDFIYRDDFTQSREEYDEETGVYDEDGDRLFKNTETNGRFHSDWCSMMYPRLVLARNMLASDGVIFISIDEAEESNLRKICDEVFGASNFISQLIWQNKKGGGNDSLYIATEHEFILVYAKSKSDLGRFYELYSDKYAVRYKEEDDMGKFFWDTFKRKSGKQYYPIECPDGTILELDDDGNPISWLRSQTRFKQDMREGEVRIIKVRDKWSVQFKQRMPEGKKPRSIFTTEGVVSDKGTTSTGADDVYGFFKKDVFSNPKPVELLKFVLGFGAGKNDIILDFFSGSGTISEAVMSLNASDGGNRTYIAVQLQEDIDKMLTSSSANARRVAENAVSVLDELGKPHLITELAKERIRRAGEKIKSEAGEKSSSSGGGPEGRGGNSPLVEGWLRSSRGGSFTQSLFPLDHPALTGTPPEEGNLDIGFRVLKLDDTNMTDVYYSPGSTTQEMLAGMESNIKPGRTDFDLLYACLLDWGLPLSMPHTHEIIDGATVHTYNDGDMIACFDDHISEEVVREIASRCGSDNRKGLATRVVFRDSCFTSSPEKINVFEIFKMLAPNMDVKKDVRVI